MLHSAGVVPMAVHHEDMYFQIIDNPSLSPCRRMYPFASLPLHYASMNEHSSLPHPTVAIRKMSHSPAEQIGSGSWSTVPSKGLAYTLPAHEDVIIASHPLNTFRQELGGFRCGNNIASRCS